MIKRPSKSSSPHPKQKTPAFTEVFLFFALYRIGYNPRRFKARSRNGVASLITVNVASATLLLLALGDLVELTLRSDGGPAVVFSVSQ
ncbi:MAG: hypothetical protein M0Z50_09215 [Planctomycetia bacterium]|nr:hypothetical protein [Planctomycetia bacterium]